MSTAPKGEETPLAPQRSLIAGEEADRVRAWDPKRVEALVAECKARGEEAGLLILGRLEARSLRAYLKPFSPNGEKIDLKGFEYNGLHCVLLSVDSCLRVETASTIFLSSRHALDK